MTFWDWFLGEAGAGWIVGILGLVVSVSLYLAARGRSSEPVIIRELDPDQPVRLTQAQYDQLLEDVGVRLEQYQAEQGLSEKQLSFDPPTLPEHTQHLYALKVAIGRKVRDSVLGGGGGWAGSTMAGFDTFIDLAAQNSLLDQRLINDIREFDWLARPGIYGDPIDDKQYKDIIKLAAKIMRELEQQSPD